MTILYALIWLFFLFQLFRDYHKAIVIYAPLSILFQDYICLRYSSPAISLSFALELIFIVFGYLKGKLYMSAFPMKKQFWFLFFVFFVGIIVSPLSVMSTLPFVVDLVLSYLIVVLYYNEHVNQYELTKTFKNLMFSVFIMGCYGLVEFATQTNPLIDFFSAQIPDTWGGVLYTTEEQRFSSVRCQSIMTICIAWGGLCCLMTSVLLFSKSIINSVYTKKLLWPFICILIIGAYTSGSRSALLYMFIILAGSYLIVERKYKFIYVLAAFAAVYFVSDQLLLVIDSFSDNSDVTGSSTSMRQLQLEAAIICILDKFLWGYGVKGLEAARGINSDVLGAESVCLQQLISYGLLGVLSQIYMYYGCFKTLLSHSVTNKFFSILVIVGWITFCTMTSSPGLYEPYFLIVIILLSKINSTCINN